MKYVIGVMVGFYILTFWLIPHHLIFPFGGVSESYLYPIYTGMILLSGLIVVCTRLVLEEMKELKEQKAVSHSER